MIGLLSLIAFILAIVAVRRSATVDSLHARIATLEMEMRLLRAGIGLGAAPAARPPERPAAPAAARPPEQPATPRPQAYEPAAAAAAAGPRREQAAPSASRPQERPAAAAAAAVGDRPAAGRTPPAPEPPEPPPAAPRRVDWERFVGVRAAAVMGGIALALAGLLFFKYSIEHDLIPPWLRVVLGTMVGVGCIAAAEWRLRVRYAGTADALAGAGLVVLYAAFWAASALYELVPMPVGFVLMVAVTAACSVLSWRHRSQVIALLGLAGGFATPLLLSSGSDRPIGLFTYILILDVGLLFIAQRRSWPLLALLSLAGTVFYEAIWIGAHMGPDRLLLGLGILGLFAVVFAAAGRTAEAEGRRQWLITQAASVLVPFAFALYFAGSARFGPHLYPTAMLLVLLCAAAGWIGRVQNAHWLGVGAASASLGVVAVWLALRELDAGLVWETVGITFALAFVFHCFVERDPENADREGPATAAIVASLGCFVLLILGSLRGTGVPPWPWLAGFAGLTALVIRHGSFREREALQPVAGLAAGLGLATLHAMHARDPAFPPIAVYLGVMMAAALAFQIVALARRSPTTRRYADHAAAVLPVVLLLYLLTGPEAFVPRIAHTPYLGLPPQVAVAPPLLFLGGTLALGFLVMLAATRLGSGHWYLVALGATALAHWRWSVGRLAASGRPAVALTALAIEAAAVVLFTAWPFLTVRRFRAERLAWYAAALAGPAWFLSLKRLFELRFGDGFIGLLPLALGAVSLVAVLRTREVWPRTDPLRTTFLAAFSAVALGFASVAIPLQLEKEWITIGWALEGLAVIALWTRHDHPGLKYFGLALFAAVTLRLVANEAVLGYYPRPSWRIVNWLLYTYLVPVAALLGASALLHPREVTRARSWERELYRLAQPVGALGTGVAGLVVIFVWLNLAIADWFATGPTLTISFARLPARDLTTSIVWAVYALFLLAIGMARRSTGLRWISLALMMITIAKVFLYDLGELRDLYRVASLLGLALSLILISLGYQRFVFRTATAERT